MKIYLRFLNGCVMRKQKFEQYKNYFINSGNELVDSAKDSDIIIVWGCSFRTDWRDNSLSVINYYIENYKDKKIIITGCLPSIAPEYIKKNNNVKIIPWKNDIEFEKVFNSYNKLYKNIQIFVEKRVCENAAEFRKDNPNIDVTFHDQFIKVLVAVGCKFNCAYCSEHLAFPKYKSFEEDKIIEACRKIIEETKVYDVMLLADNLGQYGQDVRSSLPQLVKKIKEIHPNIKFAFNNLNPYYFLYYLNDMKFFIKNDWIKHFNLPIQSASDKILKLMNRPYKKEDLAKIFKILKELNFVDFDTHLVVGFPGETEEDLDETLKFILDVKPRYVLASKYMESKNAPSAKLDNKISDDIKKKRIIHIRDILSKNSILCNTDESELSISRSFKFIKE